MKTYLFSDSIEVTGQAPSSFLLLKLGDNRFTINGKQSSFNVAPEDLQKILTEYNERKKDLIIDFDHSTLDKIASARGDAPAAGWCEIDQTDEGLQCSKVSWTEKGKNRIEAKEYRYFSPVIQFDKENGRPVSIHSIGLTNHPAIHNSMPLIAANDLLTGEGEIENMNKKIDVQEVVNGYMSIAGELKKSIGGLQVEMSNIIHAMNDAAVDFPDMTESVKQFCDTFFDEELKAFSDVTAFADISKVQDQYNTLLGGKTVEQINDIAELQKINNWIDGQITIINAENETLISGVNDDTINANNQIIDWLKSQKEIINSRISELQTNPVSTGTSPTIGSIATANEANEALAASDLPAEPMLDTADSDTKQVMESLYRAIGNEHIDRKKEYAIELLKKIISILSSEEQNEEESESPNEEMLESIMALISKQKGNGQEIESFNDIRSELMLFSDLGVKDNSTKEEIIDVIKNIHSFNEEVTTAFSDLGVKDSEGMIKLFNDKTDENKRLHAENVVDKIMFDQPGKLTESMREWAIEFAVKDVAAFNDHITNAPVSFKNADFDVIEPEDKEPVFSELATNIAKQFGNEPKDIYSV